jgi:CheY-like chemotaxis protein
MSRILVIDDDSSIRDLIETILYFEGHDPVTAADGEQGLQLLDRHQVDLIILDMMMPKVNGWQFLKAYKRRPRANPPVILYTAAVLGAHDTHQLGVSAYLLKPFDTSHLVEWVNRLTTPLSATG